jgi:hypothetical protein
VFGGFGCENGVFGFIGLVLRIFGGLISLGFIVLGFSKVSRAGLGGG